MHRPSTLLLSATAFVLTSCTSNASIQVIEEVTLPEEWVNTEDVEEKKFGFLSGEITKDDEYVMSYYGNLELELLKEYTWRVIAIDTIRDRGGHDMVIYEWLARDGDHEINVRGPEKNDLAFYYFKSELSPLCALHPNMVEFYENLVNQSEEVTIDLEAILAADDDRIRKKK